MGFMRVQALIGKAPPECLALRASEADHLPSLLLALGTDLLLFFLQGQQLLCRLLDDVWVVYRAHVGRTPNTHK